MTWFRFLDRASEDYTLDMIRGQHPNVAVTAIELKGTLFEILKAKSHQIERGDFLEHIGDPSRYLLYNKE